MTHHSGGRSRARRGTRSHRKRLIAATTQTRAARARAARRLERHRLDGTDCARRSERVRRAARSGEAARHAALLPGRRARRPAHSQARRSAACPSAIVLLDEVEKAHSHVLIVLLALLDESRIADSNGHVAQCKRERERGTEVQRARGAAHPDRTLQTRRVSQPDRRDRLLPAVQ